MNRQSVVGRAGLALALCGIALASAGGIGCDPGEDVEVCVYIAPAPYPDPFESADKVRISAIGDDADTGARTILKSREFNASRGLATLGLIPYGENVQIQIEVLGDSGSVIGYGGSILHDLLTENERAGGTLPPLICAFVTPANMVVPAVLKDSQQQSFTMIGRVGHTATVLHDGRVLITGGGQLSPVGGGLDTATISRSAEVFDVESGKFLAVQDVVMGTFTPMNVARAYHTATLLDDGRVLIAGGLTETVGMLATTPTYEIFQPDLCNYPGPESNSGVVTGCVFVEGTNTMAEARALHAATLRPDGAVFISGGEQRIAGVMDDHLATTELWTATGGFAPSGAFPLTTERSCHAQILVPDGSGNVLITGGYAANAAGDLEVRSSAERFTGTSIEGVMTMSTPRACHTLTPARLSDGQIFILAVGGYSGTTGGLLSMPSPVIEVYDPNVNQFLPMLSRALMSGAGANIGIAEHTTTALPDGRVVILGGKTGTNVTGVLVGVVSVNSPKSGPDTVLDPNVILLRPRAGHTASLLPSGQLLLVGGFDSAMSATHMAAEVFTPPSLR